MGRLLTVFLSMLLWTSGLSARELTVATWNLGWHMDMASAKAWIGECSKKYVQDATTKKWVPSDDEEAKEAKEAWDVDVFKIEAWDHSRFPVCNVYYASGAAIRVTEASYAKRQEQISRFIRNSVPADIIAFQEVSGVQAVKEILPNSGQDYELCGFNPAEKYKVHRRLFPQAWSAKGLLHRSDQMAHFR
jgi:hypothetical protein